MDSTTLFGTIHGSHYTISANFYLYLQYVQQKVFSFNKISQSQTDLDESPKKRKKFISITRGSITYYECILSPTHKLVGPTAGGLWVPPVVRGEKHTPVTGCIFSSPSLFLSAPSQSTAHQHLHLLSLSTPNLYSHCLASQPEIEIRWPSSLVPMILTFVSSENTQNHLSFSSFPTTDTKSFLAASNT